MSKKEEIWKVSEINPKILVSSEGRFALIKPSSLKRLNTTNDDRLVIHGATYSMRYLYDKAFAIADSPSYGIAYEPIEGEIWKDWKGSSRYQISNKGRVRSMCGKQPRYSHKQWRLLNPFASNKKIPHLRYAFYVDGKFCLRYITRLVYETFIGEVPDGYKVAHKDGDFTNNSVENLILMSFNDFFSNKDTRKVGKHANLKKEDRIAVAQSHFCDGIKIVELARKYNVSYSCIYSACKKYKNTVI